MSKRQFKSQASSGRLGGFGGFGSSGFGSGQSSVLSYIQEPADYSGITDSNIVVAFKNLSKKDSTTKAKALEDLQASLAIVEGDVEDAVINAWVKQYPRLSIDSARRVRQLAHQYTGQLGVKCGKRIAKQLPKIAGPWLAGTFDSDRSVSKAAEEALNTVFSSPEKIQGLRKTFQESILEYSRDAILNETVGTLSDERSINADDAKATYARVVSTAILNISSLLSNLPSSEVDKQRHTYEAVLGEKGLWDFVSHEDSSVRKAIHQLVQLCLQKESGLIEANLGAVSTAYIYKGLASDQTGSSLSFVQTIYALTTAVPTVWTSAYTGKKPALGRLRQCLKNGAYSGPAGYWDVMASVLQILPAEILPKTYDEVSDLLLAARDGVSKKEERFNASSSWPVYFTLVDKLTQSSMPEDVDNLLGAFAMPAVTQYLYPSDESTRWTISGAKPANVVSKVGTIHRLPPLLEQKWPALANKLVEIAKLSQPEQSKDFEKSQKHVATTGERWAELQREFFANDYGFLDSLRAIFIHANTTILRESIALLENRNGKPWGAAAIVEQQLRTCAAVLLQDQEYHQILLEFVANALPKIFLGASQRHLVRFILALHKDPDFGKLFNAIISHILEESSATNDAKAKAVHALFPAHVPQPAVSLAQEHAPLQSFLHSQTGGNDEATQALFASLLKLGAVTQTTSDTVLAALTESLSLDGAPREHGLSTLQQLARTNQSTVRGFMSTARGEEMLPAVVRLKDSSVESVADSAADLASLLTASYAEAPAETKYGLILQSLEKVSHSSLPIESVLDLASKVFESEIDTQNVKEGLPSIAIWRQAIWDALTTPKSSLTILSPFGGALHLLKPAEVTTHPQYDNEGLSQAMRIAIFYVAILKKISRSTLPEQDGVSVLALLNICVHLAEDGTSISGANYLWQPSQARVLEQEIMDFVSGANELLRAYWDTAATGVESKSQSSLFDELDSIATEHKGSTLAYYAALAAARAHENIFELHGSTAAQSKASEDELRIKRNAKDPLALLSYIVGFAQPLTDSPLLMRLCNEAVADLTQLQLESDVHRGLETLVLLNVILHTQPDFVDTIAKPRLIFLVKHIIPWLASDASLIIKAEVCKTLTALLPAMADMYGEQWSQIVGALVSFWSSTTDSFAARDGAESAILMTHATLKLYAALRKLGASEESNDDQIEALKDHDAPLRQGLLSLLKAGDGISDLEHQPRMATNELLARQILQTSSTPLSNAEELFPLLCAPSQAITGAAFELLHQQIPRAQEQVSLDAALDNRKAALPDELLSLVMQAPDLDALDEDAFEVTVPLPLQGYLYAWQLVFDHFQGSSFRVKGDYVEQLKEGGYLNELLELTFNLLRLNSGHPVDASTFNLLEYSSGLQATPEKEVQALLAHLFYLSLSHLPSLVKNYLNNEIKSRQAPKMIETWTAKYISPLIIEQSLTEVSQWSEKTVASDPDYEAMTIKTNLRGKEIYVSYQIDEQTMAMKIVLPEAYPLQVAKPESINRVAVTEQKWRAWLMNCQGTITFSVSLPFHLPIRPKEKHFINIYLQNGNIPDALTSFRKNVSGALKGHVECAICYSIINEAKELPTKRCPTCKNMFHNACLFKWFRSSNSSTCPLCRQPYHYT